MSKYKICFSYNQTGLQLNQWLRGDWRCVFLMNDKQIQEQGGIYAVKNRVLSSIRDYDCLPAGEHVQKDGSTLNCI